MKIPKNSKIHTKSTKPIPNQVIDFQKITQNPSIFQDPKFREITNNTILAIASTNFASSINNVGNGICGEVELWCEEEEDMRFGFCHVPCLIRSEDSNRILLCLKGVEEGYNFVLSVFDLICFDDVLGQDWLV